MSFCSGFLYRLCHYAPPPRQLRMYRQYVSAFRPGLHLIQSTWHFDPTDSQKIPFKREALWFRETEGPEDLLLLNGVDCILCPFHRACLANAMIKSDWKRSHQLSLCVVLSLLEFKFGKTDINPCLTISRKTFRYKWVAKILTEVDSGWWCRSLIFVYSDPSSFKM